ncbi:MULTISPECIES: 3-keto-5-aminohexanoate cleavage protein [unclassified Yoonia]|uniref:3-keto-5-aminohexanoate cleavage protein n=1 Tax=unclassified Yoonia TaxID=2629118 RepID=UPI002AFF907A|nr:MULTISPECIES: 3-keto-5-aminohexanoate cleavage protein [unclassified Yoonia]
MTRLLPLPQIMVAPNGARRGKADHAALPVTIAETVDTARACHAAGACALHAHVRDADGAHVLDAGLYAELIAEMAQAVPDMPVQITTEAAGIFSPADQRALLRRITPEGVSIALVEMLADGDRAAARRCYLALAEAGVAVQHILYDPAQVRQLAVEIAGGTIPPENLSVLYVLGRYTPGQVSRPEDLTPFLLAAKDAALVPDWAICAFGQGETACLIAAQALGGKLRVGFENNLHMADGRIADDNAMRVAELVGAIR